MKQIRFSRCLRCGDLYEHAEGPGIGPLYCELCRVIVRREKGRERQRKYRARKGPVR